VAIGKISTNTTHRAVPRRSLSFLSTPAVSVTLLAFTAERNMLLGEVLQRCFCWAPGSRRCRSISHAGSALSSKPTTAACGGGRMMGQTDGRPTVS